MIDDVLRQLPQATATRPLPILAFGHRRPYPCSCDECRCRATVESLGEVCDECQVGLHRGRAKHGYERPAVLYHQRTG